MAKKLKSINVNILKGDSLNRNNISFTWESDVDKPASYSGMLVLTDKISAEIAVFNAKIEAYIKAQEGI